MYGGRNDGYGADMTWGVKYIAEQDGRKYFRCNHCQTTFVATDPKWEHVCEAIPEGPGTELARIFHAWGFRQCGKCAAIAAKMNEWGPWGCAERIDEITEQIAERTWFKTISRIGIRHAVHMAIDRAAKSQKCNVALGGNGRASGSSA